MNLPDTNIVNDNNSLFKIVIDKHLKDALLDILFNKHDLKSYDGLPNDTALLQHYLCQFRRAQEETLINEVSKDEWDLLCPITGFPVPELWTTKLIVTVIIHVLSIPPPGGGWNQEFPASDDVSLGATILETKFLLEKICDPSRVQSIQYDDSCSWENLRRILSILNYSNIEKFDKLFDENREEWNIVKSVSQEHLQDQATNIPMRTEGTSETIRSDKTFLRHSSNSKKIASIANLKTTFNETDCLTQKCKQQRPARKQPIESSDNGHHVITSSQTITVQEEARSRTQFPTENEDMHNYNGRDSSCKHQVNQNDPMLSACCNRNNVDNVHSDQIDVNDQSLINRNGFENNHKKASLPETNSPVADRSSDITTSKTELYTMVKELDASTRHLSKPVKDLEFEEGLINFYF